MAANDGSESRSINIRTRSLAAVLRLLSFGVDPVIDATAPNPRLDSPPEAWQALKDESDVRGLQEKVRAVFRIHWTRRRPKHDELMVQFHDGYFWIDPEDRTSVQVFSLVRDLFDLPVTTGADVKPVLTIPVSH